MHKPGIDARRWVEMRALFDEIVELDVETRNGRLGVIGATDPELRRDVEGLLAADAAADDRLAHLDAAFASAIHTEPHAVNRDLLRLVGRTVSHFNVIAPLAVGGMGVVYRAEDIRLQRTIALKFPQPAHQVDRSTKARFLNEARSAGALEHPNICSIYEAGETEDGHLFLAMPLYDGETLNARLAREGAMPIADALAIARQIAEGLGGAHAAGIVHRDIKPANIMLVSDGVVKILDFGLAKANDLALTASRMRIGTVSYMAPEQVNGKPIDGRADLWSLGVVLFEMITGRTPFSGEHDVSVAHAIVHQQPTPPSTLRQEIPPALDDVIARLLHKDPNRRYRSAADLVAALGEIRLGQPSRGRFSWRRRTRLAYQRLRARPRRFAVLVLTAAAVALTAAGWLAGSVLKFASADRIERSVVVLPFVHPAEQTGVEYLSVGLLDGLIRQLRDIQGMRVTSLQTAMSYRSTNKPSDRIAAELNVATLLQGSVERIGDRMRVTARLVDAKTNRQLWSNEYERPAVEILGIQEDVARAVANTMGTQVTRDERARLKRRPTANARAYDLYLRGHEYELRIPSPEAQLASETLYRQALVIDSTFALARARLAAVSLDIYGNGFDRNPSRLERARADAEAALRLQPDLPDARLALGAYLIYRSDPQRALEQFQLALKTAPNNAEIYGAIGFAYTALRRQPEAIAALERSLALDPADIRTAWGLAAAYRTNRRYAEAARYDNYVIDRAPDGYLHMLMKGHNDLLWHGTTDTLADMIRRVPTGWNHAGNLTRARLTLARFRRRPADALQALNEAREDEINQYRPAALLRAQAYESLGDVARARSHYEAASRAWQDSVKAHADDRQMKALLGLAYAGLGHVRDAEEQARRALAMAVRENPEVPDRFVMMTAAEIYTRTGNAERAVQVLAKLLAVPAGNHLSVATLRTDPLWDPIRRTPQFQQLMHRYSMS